MAEQKPRRTPGDTNPNRLIEWYESLDTENRRAVKTSFLEGEYLRGKRTRPGSLDKLSYGLEEVSNATGAAWDYFKQRREGSRAMESVHREVMLEKQMYLNGEITMSHDEWQESIQERLQAAKMDDQFEEEQERKRQKADKMDYMRKQYPKIWGTELDQDWEITAGNIGKYLADPSTLSPLGRALATMVTIGGGVAAYDVALHQLADKGEIDPTELALATSLGVLGAGLMFGGGKAFLKYMKGKKERREAATSSELEQFSADIKDPVAMAKQLNEIIEPNLSLPGSLKVGERQLARPVAVRAVTGESAESFERDVAQYAQIEAAVDDMAHNEIIAIKQDPNMSTADKNLAIKKVLAERNDAQQRAWSQYKPQPNSFPNDPTKAQHNLPPVKDTGDMKMVWDEDGGSGTLKPVVKPAGKPRVRLHAPEKPRVRIPAGGGKPRVRAPGARSLQAEEVPKLLDDAMREVTDALRGTPERHVPASVRSGASDRVAATADGHAALADSVAKNMAGSASTSLMGHIAAAGAGAAIGGYVDGFEGAAAGAVLGLGGAYAIHKMSWTNPKLHIKVGMDDLGSKLKPLEDALEEVERKAPNAEAAAKMKEPIIAAMDDLKQSFEDKFVRSSLGQIFSSSSRQLEAMGQWGVRMARTLEAAETAGRFLGGKFIFKFQDQLQRHSSAWAVAKGFARGPGKLKGDVKTAFDKEFIERMQDPDFSMKTAKTPADKAMAALVEETRGRFDWILKRAVREDLIDPVKAKVLMAAKNYWPRIYNKDFLDTAEGKQKFQDIFTKDGFKSEAALENAMKHFIGPEGNLSGFKMFRNKDGSNWIISKAQANTLRIRQGKAAMERKTSTHLEHSRKVHKTPEELQPLMLSDPETIMAAYAEDTTKRIAFAKYAGKNNDKWNIMMHNAMEENGGDKSVMDQAQEIFFTATNDSRASVVKKNVNLTETERKILQKVNTFQTYKLTMAGIYNMTQATVGGMLVMSKYGFMRGMKNWWTSVKAIADAGGDKQVNWQQMIDAGDNSWTTIKGQFDRDTARRSMAAYESTIMQMVSEGHHNASLFNAWKGRGEANSVLQTMDGWTHPSEFLQYVGFVKTEKIQRYLAANMGKAHFEHLMEIKSNLFHGKFGKAGDKSYDKMHAKMVDGLEGMGLDAHRAVKDYSVDDAMNAMHVFSNTVNFTSDVSRLPLWAKTPYGKMAFKFKTFAFNHARLVKDHAIKPAIQFLDPRQKGGDLRPLATLLGVGTAVGMPTYEFRRLLAGDDRELTNVERIANYFGATGAIGLAFDTLWDLKQPYSGSLAGAVGGPTIKDILQTAQSVGTGVEKLSVMPVLRQAVKMTGGQLPLGPVGMIKKGMTSEMDTLSGWMGAYESRGDLTKKAFLDEIADMYTNRSGGSGGGGTTSGQGSGRSQGGRSQGSR